MVSASVRIVRSNPFEETGTHIVQGGKEEGKDYRYDDDNLSQEGGSVALIRDVLAIRSPIFVTW